MAEAVIIYEHLREKEYWPDVRKKATDQMNLLGAAQPMTWFKMRQKCPVLNTDTDLCRTHALRPAICSTHFVTSNPKLCDPWSTASGEFKAVDYTDLYENFQRRMTECIQSYGIFTLMMPIPTALLLAEKISVKSGLDLSEIVSLFFKEL
jgi:Fe-S-cluster containining protein